MLPKSLLFSFQDLRRQLDVTLQQKIANPRMELYTPSSHHSAPNPSSQLIQAIIDLITSEDYSDQVANGNQLLITQLCIIFVFICRQHDWQQGNTYIIENDANTHATISHVISSQCSLLHCSNNGYSLDNFYSEVH